MKVALIPKEGLATAWSACWALLALALKYTCGRYSLAHLQDDIFHQRVNLWVVFEPDHPGIEGVFTTCVVDYPAKRVLQIQFLAGEGLEDWIGEAERMLVEYAKDQHASALEMSGRFGWMPVLQRRGWRSMCVTLEKEVQHEREERITSEGRPGNYRDQPSKLSSAAL